MKKIGVVNIILILFGAWIIWNGVNVYFKSKEAALENYNVKNVSNKVDMKNNGKLIALKGDIIINRNLTDDVFGISVGELKLKRVVEMYQWEEECDEKCTYKKVWSDELIDSDEFDKNHDNPKTMPYESKEFINSGRIGEYEIPSDLISKIPYDKIMSLEEIQSSYNYYGNLNFDGSYLINYSENPKIGDYRIYYRYTVNDSVSILAAQNGNTLKKYVSSNEREIYEIRKGSYSGRQMLKKYVKSSGRGIIFSSLIGLVFIIIGLSPILPRKAN